MLFGYLLTNTAQSSPTCDLLSPDAVRRVTGHTLEAAPPAA